MSANRLHAIDAHRDTLSEAIAIAKGETLRLPTRAHLEALLAVATLCCDTLHRMGTGGGTEYGIRSQARTASLQLRTLGIGGPAGPREVKP